MPSVDISTRATPAAPAAATSRSAMLVFSAFGKTEACATSLRMSRPDIGLATMPTAEPGVSGSPVSSDGCTRPFDPPCCTSASEPVARPRRLA
jgi:hypothetical protein